MAPERTADSRPDTYTAVLYFHGIGNQRRHEELSRLVDGLDRHSYLNEDEAGRLVRIRGRFETSRTERRDDVSYIALEHHHRVSGEQKEFVDGPYRFYEAYWAPLTAGTTTMRAIALWAFRQALNPIRPLLKPWRVQARLRRIYLYRLIARRPLRGHPDRKALKPLLVAYNDFERPDKIRQYPRGTFRQFLEHLESDPATADPQFIKLARRWRRSFVASTLFNQLVLLTLSLTIAVGVAALLGGALVTLGGLSDSDLVTGVEGLADLVEPSFTNGLSLVAVFLGAVGAAGFARRYLGDVVSWATYDETDEQHRTRAAILERGLDQLRHILRDDRCHRIVVIGHSLGTTVANDVLLAFGQQYLARGGSAAEQVGDIDKLDQFITMASPVDTIHTLFESHAGKYHRYTRVFESLRGDVGRHPFARRRKPHMHWINIWDRADIIGGPLFSPNQAQASALPVDNYEVRSLSFPDPANSHVAYFEHAEVIGILFRVIFEDAYSYRNGNPSEQRLTTSVPSPRLTAWQVPMVALPWLTAFYGAARVLELPAGITAASGWAAIGLALVVSAGWLIGRLRGHLHPL